MANKQPPNQSHRFPHLPAKPHPVEIFNPPGPPLPVAALSPIQPLTYPCSKPGCKLPAARTPATTFPPIWFARFLGSPRRRPTIKWREYRIRSLK